MATKPSPDSSGKANKSSNQRAQLRAHQEAVAKQKRLNRIILISAAAVAVVLIGVFTFLFFQKPSDTTTSDSYTPVNATENRDGLFVKRDGLDASAPKVEVFFDYQCGSCGQFDSIFGDELVSMSREGKIDLVYRPMNFLDRGTTDGSGPSTRAAMATTCASDQGKLAEYHKSVFAVQSGGYPEQVLRETVPQQVGLTGDALTSFQKCYDDSTPHDFIKGTNEQAGRDGITSTPTLRVNGNKMELGDLNMNDPSSIRSLIEKN